MTVSLDVLSCEHESSLNIIEQVSLLINSKITCRLQSIILVLILILNRVEAQSLLKSSFSPFSSNTLL